MPEEGFIPYNALPPFIDTNRRKFWGVTRRRTAAFFQGYSKLLETRYYMMSFIQATALGVLGDLIAQVSRLIGRRAGR